MLVMLVMWVIKGMLIGEGSKKIGITLVFDQTGGGRGDLQGYIKNQTPCLKMYFLSEYAEQYQISLKRFDSRISNMMHHGAFGPVGPVRWCS